MWARACSSAGLVAVVAAVASGCGGHARPLKVGMFAFCGGQLGNLAFQQERADAGAELPFLRRGAKLLGKTPSAGITDVSVGGRRVELLLRCAGFGQWSSVIDEVRRLVEQDGADAIVLPFTVDVDAALEPYIEMHPGVTFVAPATDETTTLKHPLPNLFRFELDWAQISAGLGTYAYRTLGWRKAVTVGADAPSDWSQVAGFVSEFCSLGGEVVQRLWAPITELDYRPLVRHVRAKGVDGIFFTGAVGGGTQSLAAAWRAQKPDLPRHLLVGTFSLFFDPSPSWAGVVGGSGFPYAPTPAWTRYVADLKRLTGQSSFLLDTTYFNATEALLEAVTQVHGDTSHGERRLQHALARLRLATPKGPIRLDASHQEIGETYLGRLGQDAHGRLLIRQIRVIRNVDATYGGHFGKATPPPSKTQPVCRRGDPPPWAH